MATDSDRGGRKGWASGRCTVASSIGVIRVELIVYRNSLCDLLLNCDLGLEQTLTGG